MRTAEKIALSHQICTVQNGWATWDQLTPNQKAGVREQWTGELERLWWRFDRVRGAIYATTEDFDAQA
jgi:hypothetical protein